MSEITKHAPGMLCWTDLTTRDVNAAKRFYPELLGWSTRDTPMPEGGVYVMAQQGGKDVAAISAMTKEQQKQGMPPMWNSYFAVTNADEVAKKIVAAGGKLLAEPFDAMDAGRMCIAQDPSGAMFSLWQAKKHLGAGRMNEPGALCWTELETSNVDACRGFYTKVFGWKTETRQMAEGPYVVFSAGEKQVCGMMACSKNTPKGTPSHWTVYFAVKGCDDTVEKAKKLGAKIVVPPADIPDVGRFAMMFDPQGAFFAVLQPSPRM